MELLNVYITHHVVAKCVAAIFAALIIPSILLQFFDEEFRHFSNYRKALKGYFYRPPLLSRAFLLRFCNSNFVKFTAVLFMLYFLIYYNLFFTHLVVVNEMYFYLAIGAIIGICLFLLTIDVDYSKHNYWLHDGKQIEAPVNLFDYNLYSKNTKVVPKCFFYVIVVIGSRSIDGLYTHRHTTPLMDGYKNPIHTSRLGTLVDLHQDYIPTIVTAAGCSLETEFTGFIGAICMPIPKTGVVDISYTALRKMLLTKPEFSTDEHVGSYQNWLKEFLKEYSNKKSAFFKTSFYPELF